MQDRASAVSFLERLSELEDYIRSRSRMPMSRNVVVEQEELLDLVDQLRMALLEDVRRAQQLLKRREEILTEAQREAETLRGDAMARAEQLLTPGSLDRRTMERVQALDLAAQRQAEMLFREADDHAAEVLARLERELQRLSGVAAQAREQLQTFLRGDGRAPLEVPASERERA
ncbi:MAG: hypothetical protein HY691_20300 [Chloroflexi bacterium]|nr:hypothetical protein [Chloroflexota bacterium]